MIHELKTWPRFFQPLLDGIKKFELREDDRNFQVGDILNLREYIPETSDYSGRFIKFMVVYKLTHADFPKGIQPGYCILGLQQ